MTVKRRVVGAPEERGRGLPIRVKESVGRLSIG